MRKRISNRPPPGDWLAATKAGVFLFLFLALIGQASGEVPSEVDRQPATIVSLNDHVGFLKITIFPKVRRQKFEPYPATPSVKSAKVIFITPPNHQEEKQITDLKPGMNVLVTGILSVSSNFLTEIVVDQRPKLK